MKVFVDTSGVFSLLVKNDSMHSRAKTNFATLEGQKAHLFTSSFVLLETIALLQRRVGFDAVRDFNTKILPLFEIVWADKEWYGRAVQRLFLQGNKDISVVDCLSFEIMETFDILLVFTFDKHFHDLGFNVFSGE